MTEAGLSPNWSSLNPLEIEFLLTRWKTELLVTSGTMTRTFECLSENWKTGVGPDLRKRKVSSIAFFSAPVSKHCMISLFSRWWSTWSWESTWSWMQVLKACLCMMQGRPLCTLQFNWQPSLHKLGLSSRVAKEQPELKQQTQQNSILGVVGQNTNTQKRGNSGYSLT